MSDQSDSFIMPFDSIENADDLLLHLSNLLDRNVVVQANQMNDLLNLYFNHQNKYVKHVCAKVIVKNSNSKIVDEIISFGEDFFLKCKLLYCILLPDNNFDSSNYQSIVNWLCSKLNQSDQEQCLCGALKLLNFSLKKCDAFVSESLDELVLSFSNNCFQVKRCVLFEFLTLELAILDINWLNNCHSIINQQTNSDYFVSSVSMENFIKPISFCGEIQCKRDDGSAHDKVILRKIVLLFLKSNVYQKNDRFDLNMKTISSYFDQKFHSNSDWLIKLFIDDDVELLNALYYLIKMNCNEIHQLLAVFFHGIHNDSSVLLDMLCNDQETAVCLLKMLLAYLKLENINDNINDNVKLVLLELNEKIERLLHKNLFPYKVEPLIKLLHKLK